MTHFTAAVFKAGNTPQSHPFHKSHLSFLQWLMPQNSPLIDEGDYENLDLSAHDNIRDFSFQCVMNMRLCVQGFFLTRKRAAKTEWPLVRAVWAEHSV